jgi:hypothetical protein
MVYSRVSAPLDGRHCKVGVISPARRPFGARTSRLGVQASNALREIKATAQKEVVIVSILVRACHVQLTVVWSD